MSENQTETYCEECGALKSAGAACLNVGACNAADRAATRNARGTTLKSPLAVTRSGAID